MKKGSAVILSIIAAVAVIGLAFVLMQPAQSPTGATPGSGQIIPAFKVPVCHEGTTLFVAPGAVIEHQAHGDALGTCGTEPTPTQPEPTNTPMATDTPVPTATPIDTLAPTPTDTPAPTMTSTPEPTQGFLLPH